MAVAPKIVRVDQTYNVYVTLYSMPYKQLRIRATLSRNNVEYASNVNTYIDTGMKHLQLRVRIRLLHMLKL